MLLRSLPLAATLALLALLPMAAPAAGVSLARPPIVPQSSIRGIALGMTPTEVRAALGGPPSSGISPNPVIGKVRIWRYEGLRIMFDSVKPGRTVLSLTTTSRRDRTVSGVGVGSKEAAVARGVPGVRCVTRYGYRTCMVGGERPGQAATDFAISRAGRVVRVTLGRVID